MLSDRSRGLAAQVLVLLPPESLARLLRAHFPSVAESYSTDSNSLFHLCCDEDQTAVTAMIAQVLVQQEDPSLPASRMALLRTRLDELRATLAADGWTVRDDTLTYTPVDSSVRLLNAVSDVLSAVQLDPDGHLATALRTTHQAFNKTESAEIGVGCTAARRALDLLFERAGAAGAAKGGAAYTHRSTAGALATLCDANIISAADAGMLSRTHAGIHTRIDALVEKPHVDETQWVEQMVIWTCGYVGSQFAAV
jgi:hypothetical protein